ncbi:MAG: DUF4382 domain-containing protein [Cyclobacteriaceae bacterium]
MKKLAFKILTMSIAAASFIACSDDGENVSPNPGNGGNETPQGQANIQMTDAPADDANVEAVFVTVTEINVDGEAFAGFSGPQTIDLMSYQNGNTKLMGTGNLDAKSYSNIELVFDFEEDANGNFPGCYVETKDKVKHQLKTQSNSNAFVSRGSFDIEENSSSDIVLDFDIRKAIKYSDDNSSSSQFTLVSKSEVESSIRLLNERSTGMIEGTVDASTTSSSDEKIVAFAYVKNSFDESAEVEGQGASNIRFKNAVNSSVVNNGSFTLAFLPEGEYEIVFFSFEEDESDTDGDGNNSELMLKSRLEIESALGLDLSSISVNAQSTVSLSIDATGIIGIN